MKPGDALILDGKTHLVVAVGTLVAIQAPDGTISEYTRDQLTTFLCGPVPMPSQEDIRKMMGRSEPSPPIGWSDPSYYYDHGRKRPMAPYQSAEYQREFERKLREYVDAIEKGNKPR